jgi:predicted amidohydrolase
MKTRILPIARPNCYCALIPLHRSHSPPWPEILSSPPPRSAPSIATRPNQRQSPDSSNSCAKHRKKASNSFFPRYFFEDHEALDSFFEHGEDITKSPDVKPLFDEAKELKIDIVLGYAERTPNGTGYNTSVYYSASEDKVLSKYRKVHLPGTVEPFKDPEATNQLEKRYFTPGDLGFNAFRAPGLVADAIKKSTAKDGESTVGKGDPILGMMICNDRRWPEAWRTYSLQGAEILMFGYNTGANM